MKVKVKITNNLSLDERKKEVLKIVNTRNKEHLDIQINNPSKIFKNKIRLFSFPRHYGFSAWAAGAL